MVMRMSFSTMVMQRLLSFFLLQNHTFFGNVVLLFGRKLWQKLCENLIHWLAKQFH